MAAAAPRLRRHTVQLATVLTTEAVAHRRPSRDRDTAEPRLSPRRGRLEKLSEDGLSLAVSVRASIRLRLADDETWDARVVILGHFTSGKKLSDSDALFFAESSGFFVLWPFARASLDAMARLSSVVAPQLPLLVRPVILPPKARTVRPT